MAVLTREETRQHEFEGYAGSITQLLPFHKKGSREYESIKGKSKGSIV
jgi:hypothetical protein